VASAFGFVDAESLPIELALSNAARIVAAVGLPVTLDFEGGYAVDPLQLKQNATMALEAGVVGFNFEDQVIGGEGLHDLATQCGRIRAIRDACDEFGVNAFINARTDYFLKAPREAHDDGLVDQALQRANAYADAGASGFFVPGLINPKMIERMCSNGPLPVNVMAMKGMPEAGDLAALGVARISHGPGPWRSVMAHLGTLAKEVLG
jgi:2-methylisocitrate lyase-like PEP mutase family enzyme